MTVGGRPPWMKIGVVRSNLIGNGLIGIDGGFSCGVWLVQAQTTKFVCKMVVV